jgi:hypothetical protein
VSKRRVQGNKNRDQGAEGSRVQGLKNKSPRAKRKYFKHEAEGKREGPRDQGVEGARVEE